MHVEGWLFSAEGSRNLTPGPFPGREGESDRMRGAGPDAWGLVVFCESIKVYVSPFPGREGGQGVRFVSYEKARLYTSPAKNTQPTPHH